MNFNFVPAEATFEVFKPNTPSPSTLGPLPHKVTAHQSWDLQGPGGNILGLSFPVQRPWWGQTGRADRQRWWESCPQECLDLHSQPVLKC